MTAPTDPFVGGFLADDDDEPRAPRRHLTDAQLQALRAELEALAPRVTSPDERVAYVTLGCAPIGSGDGGLY